MTHFRELINWGVQLTDQDLFMKSGAAMASVRYLPKDLASISPEEAAQADEALNRIIMRFNKYWTLWFECQRNTITRYTPHQYTNPVARAIELDRTRFFQTPGNQFENLYVLSMMYMPQTGNVSRVASLYKGGSEADHWLAEYKVFLAQFRSILSTLKDTMVRVAPLTGGGLKSYLHGCVSIYNQQVNHSDLPDVSIAARLLDCKLTGGSKPMLAHHHLRTVKIDGQPLDSYRSGILDIINNAPFELRNVDRFQPLNPEDALAEIDATTSRWDSATKPLLGLIKKQAVGGKEKVDAFSAMSAAGTSAAAVALKSGTTGFGRMTHTITVHDADLAVVEKRCQWLTDRIRDAGFTCYIAEDFDAVPAYMSSIPGHSKPDPGKLFVATCNVAKIVPSTAPWTGPAWDDKLNGPPLLRCCGLGGTLFRYVLHQPGTPVPHAILDGSTGSGKSLLAGAMAWGFLQYPQSNVVFIDFLASSKGITLALEGTFYGFSAGKKVSLQPLRGVDDPKEKTWAVQFMCAFLRHLKVEMTPHRVQEVNTALDIIATRPPNRRTLTNFQSFVQDEEIWDALDMFIVGGAYGHLLDNETHSLGSGERIRSYEMNELVKNDDALGPVLYVIFHEVQRQLTGDPMLFVVDEAQHLKRFGAFKEHIEEYLETGRKNGMAVLLITPNLREFTSDPKLSSLIARSCKTHLFGANPAALSNKDDREAYRSFGVSEERMEVIGKLKTWTPDDPSHYYAFSHENGSWALFDGKFSKMQVAFFGRNSPEDKDAMDQILEEFPREEYPQRWLRYCGFTDDEIINFGFAWSHGKE